MNLTFLSLSLLISTSALAKIVSDNGQYFVETKDGKKPLMNVNDMIKKKTISKVKIYGDGKVNLISFAKDDGPMQLHSVDEKGFIYNIEPFSKYEVTEVFSDGKFTFKEAPNRKYTVNSKGLFLY